MNIDVLLQAANYIETGGYVAEISEERTTKHIKSIDDYSPSCEGSDSFSYSREIHNKLEKNRRAHLKECFDQLKSRIPFLKDKSKVSNLGILRSALRHIQALKRKEKELELQVQELSMSKILRQTQLRKLEKLALLSRVIHDNTVTNSLSEATESNEETDSNEEDELGTHSANPNFPTNRAVHDSERSLGRVEIKKEEWVAVDSCKRPPLSLENQVSCTASRSSIMAQNPVLAKAVQKPLRCKELGLQRCDLLAEDKEPLQSAGQKALQEHLRKRLFTPATDEMPNRFASYNIHPVVIAPSTVSQFKPPSPQSSLGSFLVPCVSQPSVSTLQLLKSPAPTLTMQSMPILATTLTATSPLIFNVAPIKGSQ